MPPKKKEANMWVENATENEKLAGKMATQALKNAAAGIAANTVLLKSMIDGGEPDVVAGKPAQKGKRKAPATRDPAAAPPKKKRPLTSYLLFSQSVRPSLPPGTPTELMKAIAAKWRDLPEAEKQEWKAKADTLAAQDQAGGAADAAEDQPEVDDADTAAPATDEVLSEKREKKKEKKKKREERAA